MADPTIRPLKEHGVPLGARIVFRLQWLPFLLMSVLLALTLPVVLVVGFFLPDAADDFMAGAHDVLESRLERLRAHRARVIAMYMGGEHA